MPKTKIQSIVFTAMMVFCMVMFPDSTFTANIFCRSICTSDVQKCIQWRRDDRFIKCSKCELKAWCRGCPAVANGTNGDFYGADPQCWKIKNERTGERLSC